MPVMNLLRGCLTPATEFTPSRSGSGDFPSCEHPHSKLLWDVGYNWKVLSPLQQQTATLLTVSFSLSQVIMPQSRWLRREEKAAIPAFPVCVHLHVTRINGRVNHSPGSSSQLRLRWDVNEHGLTILSQAVHNVGTELEHLVVHVCRKRTQRLRSQHVNASALPRWVKLGKK